jgi:hypothetical protein
MQDQLQKSDKKSVILLVDDEKPIVDVCAKKADRRRLCEDAKPFRL